MNVMIVEDELASQKYLKHFLQQHFPAFNIIAVTDNVPDAISALEKMNPDILFLDVDIKMGTGFDVLAAVPGIETEIIFTTAFNQFAINAFEYHAVDYLLKPLEDNRLMEAIDHCRNRVKQKKDSKQIENLLQQWQQPVEASRKRISVTINGGVEFIETGDILCAIAKGNYTEIKLKDGSKKLVSKKLKDIEEHLPSISFLRIHNSYIVNISSIKKYYNGRGGYVELQDETSLPVSSARKDELLKHLGS
ncbi:MAG TPA: LytTR family DNA-binding domain-containing protein [Chitinophagaceae bacterium]|nr:LytTR family DNA-binding domain-containing protein [Chitinophagaceae bacterium]